MSVPPRCRLPLYVGGSSEYGADGSEIAGAFGSKPLYRNLGYFSTICLLRVHVLLGDPTCKSTPFSEDKIHADK